jgi:hypothetical protein
MTPFRRFILVVATIALVAGCAKDDSHWGQDLDPQGKWWKKEGQSWDRKSNIFMAVGWSNPDWAEKYDQRKSADLDARSQVASFMQSLVRNYMEEVRSRNFAISEGVVEASANQAVTGSIIVARHCKKGGKYKGCQSLVKVDLSQFFCSIEKEFADRMARDMRKKSARMTAAELDAAIEEKTKAALEDLKKAEEPAVEKALKSGD